MHHGALFGVVDGFAGKHGIAVRRQPGLLRQLQQQRLCCRIDPVFGQVGEHMGGTLTEGIKTRGVSGKCAAHIKVAAAVSECCLQRNPGRRAVTTVGIHGRFLLRRQRSSRQQHLIELAGIGAKPANTLGQLLGAHGILIQRKAETGFVIVHMRQIQRLGGLGI